ncbi:2-amino-4-hydroxy-6-hydroxymethyldihydropteridine diphosphokinase [Ferrimonas sediminicola]|uniref:2-amino-4-hydroxy-6-hydroxymethyldihydropteridine diphosphokinase n=1 Tax=Ferrimonas sediminicola TaxID=2569538 RepID=A0A4V5NVQ6_9GAMM|nr:2-amino-4-hydroxy-6-hydroxymethyldihydropteridine diphosphokinase [Ferrimonas sediminicola]TKB51431.1 2-amino-4-hydroxy-6-hydroxymethyldihydropteridine diphosphokinase [Ferrimonas sediminicola]
MTRIYISVGSNICPRENIPPALDDLYRRFGPLTLSRVFESEAVGFDGDNFLNFVVACDSQLSVAETAAALRRIELDHGRPPDAQKFSSRTVDLDLLLYGDAQCREPVVLPRGEIRDNAFVLWPLAELAPELILPGGDLPLSRLWQEFDKTQQKLWPVAFHWSPSGDMQ